jgi:hypothetical protein
MKSLLLAGATKPPDREEERDGGREDDQQPEGELSHLDFFDHVANRHSQPLPVQNEKAAVSSPRVRSPAMSDRTTMHQLATEIAALRRELDVQFRRIASIQAELDVLPTGRRRRAELLGFLATAPPSNGRPPTPQ